MSCNQREDRWGATLSVICTSFKTSFPLSFSLSLPPFSISLFRSSLSPFISHAVFLLNPPLSPSSLSLSLSVSLSFSLSLSPFYFPCYRPSLSLCLYLHSCTSFKTFPITLSLSLFFSSSKLCLNLRVVSSVSTHPIFTYTKVEPNHISTNLLKMFLA